MQELLDKWNIKTDYNTLLAMWNEPQRFYHNQTHLQDLIDKINNRYKNQLEPKDYEKLMLCALFHDCVYNPMKDNNEERSAAFFMIACVDKDNPDIQEIKTMILDTKTHESNSRLSELFNELDMSICRGNLQELMAWENGIYQEFKGYGNQLYKMGRLKFLNSLPDKYPDNAENLSKLIAYVKSNYNT